MGVIYSGQPITNTTVDGSTNDTLNQAIKNALITAGWSLIKSGSGDGIWRLRSAATPQGMQGDIWMWRGHGQSCSIVLCGVQQLGHHQCPRAAGAERCDRAGRQRLQLPTGCQRLLLLPIPQRDSDAGATVLLLHRPVHPAQPRGACELDHLRERKQQPQATRLAPVGCLAQVPTPSPISTARAATARPVQPLRGGNEHQADLVRWKLRILRNRASWRPDQRQRSNRADPSTPAATNGTPWSSTSPSAGNHHLLRMAGRGTCSPRAPIRP